jgi:hypothetical protein
VKAKEADHSRCWLSPAIALAVLASAVSCTSRPGGTRGLPPGAAAPACLEQRPLTPQERKVLGELDAEILALDRLPPAADPRALPAEISARVKVDQDVRMPLPDAPSHGTAFKSALNERAMLADEKNVGRMREIVGRWGWPTRSVVGDGTATSLWLLAQHADRDVAFQRQVLAEMEALIGRREVRAQDLAYLRDRVAVNSGSRQRYGTQGGCAGPGRWEPHALQSPTTVDEDRREMGLGPLADYIRRGRQLCP